MILSVSASSIEPTCHGGFPLLCPPTMQCEVA